jgi:hypothetical protein
VLTTNSIPHWDTTNHRDVLTLTFSVDDSTVQAIRLEGIANYIQNLPNVQTLLKTGDLPQPPTDARGRQYALAGDNARACAGKAAWEFTVKYTEPFTSVENVKKEQIEAVLKSVEEKMEEQKKEKSVKEKAERLKLKEDLMEEIKAEVGKEIKDEIRKEVKEEMRLTSDSRRAAKDVADDDPILTRPVLTRDIGGEGRAIEDAGQIARY